MEIPRFLIKVLCEVLRGDGDHFKEMKSTWKIDFDYDAGLVLLYLVANWVAPPLSESRIDKIFRAAFRGVWEGTFASELEQIASDGILAKFLLALDPEATDRMGRIFAAKDLEEAFSDNMTYIAGLFAELKMGPIVAALYLQTEADSENEGLLDHLLDEMDHEVPDRPEPEDDDEGGPGG